MAMATETVRLRIEGMGCDGCVTAVHDALSRLPGVREVTVALEQGAAVVEAEAPADRQAMVTAVDHAGYEAVPS